MTSQLRIVTWNCNMALRLKFDRLRSLRPDVAVVQECADPDAVGKGWRPDCTSYDWIGFNPDKGLGIFTFGDLALTRHSNYAETYTLYLPVTVSGWCHFNLLGMWAADPRRIPAGTTNDPFPALQHYHDFLAAEPSVVAGDFNRLPQQMSVQRNGPGSSVVDLLADAGLTNADFAMNDASRQPALRRTHFHQRKFFAASWSTTFSSRLPRPSTSPRSRWAIRTTGSPGAIMCRSLPGSTCPRAAALRDDFRQDRTGVL